MFIPKNYQIPAKYTVTVTHYVSLQLPLSDIPLHRPLAQAKHLSTILHP